MSSTDSLHAIPSLPFPNLANSTLSIIRIYTGSIADRSRYTDKVAPVPPSPFHLDLPGNLFKLTLACSLNLRSFQLHFSSSSSHSFHGDYVIQLWRMRMLGSYHWIKKRVIQYQQKRELLSLQSTMAMAVSNNLAIPLSSVFVRSLISIRSHSHRFDSSEIRRRYSSSSISRKPTFPKEGLERCPETSILRNG